jgi:hypothetical protein
VLFERLASIGNKVTQSLYHFGKEFKFDPSWPEELLLESAVASIFRLPQFFPSITVGDFPFSYFSFFFSIILGRISSSRLMII